MTDEELKEIIGESEGTIQTRIINYLEALDYIVIRHNAGYVKNNVKLSPIYTPDLQVIMFDSQIVWIEVKKPGKNLSEGQRKMKLNLESRGQKVIVCRSIEDVKNGVCWKGKESSKPLKIDC